ncbi:hypothetical protein N0V94_004972 [Neodidymelliopsis sp. IMI 364377]|nr:hypothetical protein N0V94_004972 [Neodidymelliopsis sp. IMI 364377]
MKNTIILAALTALAAAQTIADLPSCSLECLASAIGGLQCELTDFACSCQKADKLTPVITPCIQTACTDAADQAKTIKVLSGLCAAAGFPIEAPAAPEATSSPGYDAPVETQPYATDAPEYPTASVSASEYSASTRATDDVPNLPSSLLPSDYIPLPSFVDTIIVSRPSPKPTSVPGVLPPYPTGSPASSVPVPSGGPTSTSSDLPAFTGAAVAAKVPFAVAGVFGVAAFVL